jgi:hypothetical protein
MVAVALAANAIGSDVAADGDGTFGRIRDHLETKGVVALVDMIMPVAERIRLAFGAYSARSSYRLSFARSEERQPLCRGRREERRAHALEAGQRAAISATRA